MRKLKVLIVDDNPAISKGLSSIIEMESDIEIVGIARNGPEAIWKADQLSPDVILMDANMPHTDGVESTIFIKKRLPEVKVLFLTTHNGYVDEAVAAGADGYLMKDTPANQLVDSIRDACRD